MRIDYKHPAANRVKIYLNGRDVTKLAVEADEDFGWIEMVVLDVNGHPIWDHESNMPLTVQVQGAVKIQFQSQWLCKTCLRMFNTPAEWSRHLATPHYSVN
ncbi:MAG: hypothetical protein DHS20C20_30750 [Ardenticatenaceae bacterium]|nr:MAG: hypothetical protein DHS20C20_30750 [Ardenticatenaceae bacterium]